METTYTPDFWVKDLNLYVEVKGYWRDDAKAKFNAFQKQYPELCVEVWDEAKLRTMKIF